MKYFTYSEFDSPDEVGSGVNMNSDFLTMLERARELAGVPFIVNSGYRTKKHNEFVGGSEKSSHIKGRAVDIKCTTSRERHIIIQALLSVGFNRIGIAKSFIHVDNDNEKYPNCIWVY